MKTNLRQTQLTLLLGLLVLSGLTTYAYRTSEQWHGHSIEPAVQPSAILSHTGGRNTITPSIVLPITVGAGHETVPEPAQGGGSYNITQSVIASGGGASSGGSYGETGVIGQSVVGTSIGGQYSVEGGFLVGGQSGGCQVILVNPPTLPNGSVGVSYPSQMFNAAGGTAPYSFTVSIGNLPTGLSLIGDTLSGTPTAAGTFNFTITATDNLGCQGFQVYAVTISNVSGGLQFYPLAHPVRLLDTRVGATACDAPGMMIQGQTSHTQTAAGRICDGLSIPANAKALTGNITTVESGGGFLTLYPSDAQRPLVANSNFAPNQVLNNVFTVGLGAVDGAFNIFVTTDTNIVVDITGYYAPPSVAGLYFHSLSKPVRLLDTRMGAIACFTPGLALQAGSTTSQLGQTLCDGVTIPASAQALVGNATTVGPQSGGFLTLFPANAAQPLAASSNFQTGINMNAPFIVGLSPSGEFNIFANATTDLVIDVLGYYSTQLNDVNGQGLLFNILPAPVRLLDTRANQQACFTPGAQMIGGATYLQAATGACTNIPAAALAVVGNATTVNATANGFLTFWPSSALQPTVATSNFRTGQAFNRHFTVGLGLDGAFNRFSNRTTDLVIDLSGFFAP